MFNVQWPNGDVFLPGPFPTKDSAWEAFCDSQDDNSGLGRDGNVITDNGVIVARIISTMEYCVNLIQQHPGNDGTGLYLYEGIDGDVARAFYEAVRNAFNAVVDSGDDIYEWKIEEIGDETRTVWVTPDGVRRTLKLESENC